MLVPSVFFFLFIFASKSRVLRCLSLSIRQSICRRRAKTANFVDFWKKKVDVNFIAINQWIEFSLFDFFLFLSAGKMFKSADLPYLITFFQMFFNDKPIDWLLEYFINTRVCNWDKDAVSLTYFYYFFLSIDSWPRVKRKQITYKSWLMHFQWLMAAQLNRVKSNKTEKNKILAQFPAETLSSGEG